MTDNLERLRNALADRYAIQRELGRGGMATVYLATDLKHKRSVALKVLRADLAAELGAERFLREIQVAARLTHPHILPLHDSGEADGLLYYVMPYVEGESLRTRLSRERLLPVEDGVRIAREVADALAYAHEHDVVHRDIKPENILLSGGHAIVTDFGIARAVGAARSDSLTRTGTALGTPAYMSPEQAAGEAEVDGRSDLYSLGCVLYEMLAGEPPFSGPTAQAVIARRFTSPVPQVSELRPSVPAALARALAKALAPVPADRHPTTAQFASALAVVGPPMAEARKAAEPAALSAAEPAAGKSIAVLPFADMSPEKDQDYFCDGMAEELINALMKIEELRIASRTSAFAFKGKNQDIRQIGEQLNVNLVLEGSVRKAGNRLRITAQLINVADGYHVWSERFDRELEDVFAIQDEIAESTARALRVQLTQKEKRAIEKAPTADVRAYDYFLRGRHYLYQFRRKSFEFAQQMFARALEIDPRYARAYAGVADCCSYLYMYWEPSQANLEQADRASRKALELDPELADAHVARGLALSLRKQYEEAGRELEEAIRLNANLFDAYYCYARVCFAQGKLEQAAELFEQAGRVNPDDYNAPTLLVQTYVSLGRQTEASAASRRSLQLIEKHVEMHPDDPRALYFGAGRLAAIGERERGLEWAKRALAMDPEDPGGLYNIACAYANLGEPEGALDCLEKAVRNGFAQKEWIEHDSDLDPLRDHPRFGALLERM